MNLDTLLYRQVHPNHVLTNGRRLSSEVFVPEGKDSNEFSTYNGDLISAEGALEHYTVKLGRKSVGIIGLTVAVFLQHGLTPIHDGLEFPEHVTVIYPDGITRNQRKKRARSLAIAATTWYARA